jgi:DNA-binding transcriptional MerR regulator
MPAGDGRSARVTRRELVLYQSHGLLVLEPGEQPTEAQMQRVRRIRRLHRDLGLSYEAIDVVLRLLDRLEAAEAPPRPERRPALRITVLGR